jgi:hypothetical protein
MAGMAGMAGVMEMLHGYHRAPPTTRIGGAALPRFSATSSGLLTQWPGRITTTKPGLPLRCQ